MGDTYLINITGKNSFSAIAESIYLLSDFQGYLLDIKEAVVFDTLSLAIVVEFTKNSHIDNLIKDLLYNCHQRELHLEIRKINSGEIYRSGEDNRKKKYIITVVGTYLYAIHLGKILQILEPHNTKITSIERLSRIKPLDIKEKTEVCAIEITLEGIELPLKDIRKRFLELSQKMEIDIGIQEDTPYRRHRRLIAFDMDSTLIQTEVIDELAEVAGVRDKVAEITERTMRGEINFKESLRKRVSMLKGLPLERLRHVAKHLPLTEGAPRLIKNLKVLGYKIAIISGGFTFFGNHLKKILDIDYVYANELEIKEDRLTGRILGKIIDGEEKAKLLKKIAQKEHISLEQVIAVGDGANDLPMLNLAGLGIAFRAKPVVREGAKQSLTNVGLDAILYFLGLTEKEAVV